jgi:hypothetical protein
MYYASDQDAEMASCFPGFAGVCLTLTKFYLFAAKCLALDVIVASRMCIVRETVQHLLLDLGGLDAQQLPSSKTVAVSCLLSLLKATATHEVWWIPVSGSYWILWGCSSCCVNI